ncbi:MAG: hypothetical protein ACJ790_11520 [Myxococcaceae bacterium]
MLLSLGFGVAPMALWAVVSGNGYLKDMSTRPALAWIAGLLLMGGTAVARRDPFPRGRPPSSMELEQNQQQAIEFSSQAIVVGGYANAQVREATELWPNYWRVRYALPAAHSGKVLDVYFDGAEKRVVRQQVVPGGVTPQ